MSSIALSPSMSLEPRRLDLLCSRPCSDAILRDRSLRHLWGLREIRPGQGQGQPYTSRLVTVSTTVHRDCSVGSSPVSEFGNDFDLLNVDPVSRKKKDWKWRCGINFSTEHSDAMHHFAVSCFAETQDLFATLDLCGWHASLLEEADKAHNGSASGTYDSPASESCDGSNEEMHVTVCCGQLTVCEDVVVADGLALCRSCTDVFGWPETDLPPHVSSLLKSRYQGDRRLWAARGGKSSSFHVQDPTALVAGVEQKFVAADTHQENPLLRTTIIINWPVAVVGNGGKKKTSMSFADNFTCARAVVGRIAWAQSLCSTRPVLRAMAAYQKGNGVERERALLLASDHASKEAFKSAVVPFANAEFARQQAKVKVEREKIKFTRKARAAMPPDSVQSAQLAINAAPTIAPAVMPSSSFKGYYVPIAQMTNGNEIRLRNLVTAMAIEIARQNGYPPRTLPLGPTGLPNPFVGEANNGTWTYQVMKRLFTPLLNRTRATCNRHHVLDKHSSFETHYLNACWSVLKGDGLCDIIGLPLTSKVRSHTRMSLGHIHHGRNMHSGET